MAETIAGGYYLSADQESAHNANGQPVKLLSASEIEALKKSGEAAPLLSEAQNAAAFKAPAKTAVKKARGKK